MKHILATALLASSYAFADEFISKEEAVSKVCNESKALCDLLGNVKLYDSGHPTNTKRGKSVLPYKFGGTFNGRIISVVIGRNRYNEITVSISEDKPGTAGFATD